MLAAIFSSPKEIWFIIGLGRNRLVNSGQDENRKDFLFCVNVFIIFDMLTDYEMKVSIHVHLTQIQNPSFLKDMSISELEGLSEDIRKF